MSIRIDLNKEIKSCKDCELYKNCNVRSLESDKCVRKSIIQNFEELYETDDIIEGVSTCRGIADGFNPNKKPKKREKSVESYLKEQVEKLGGKCYKFESPRHCRYAGPHRGV